MKVLLGGTDTLADGIAEFLQQLEWTELIGLVGTRGPAVNRAKEAGIGLFKPSAPKQVGADIFLAAELPSKHHLKWGDATRLGGLHIHLSLLPSHRGVDPVRWAMIEGDPACGATVHYITEESYCGNILAQEKVDVKAVHNAVVMEEILRGTARDMIVKVLHALAKIGPLPGTPQKVDNISQHDEQVDDKLGVLDFGEPMEEVHRRIQTFCNPHCGARAKLGKKEVMIWRTLPLQPKPPPGAKPDMITGKDFKANRKTDKKEGTVLAGPEGRMAVRCGCGGVLELLELQVGGKGYEPLPPTECVKQGDVLKKGSAPSD